MDKEKVTIQVQELHKKTKICDSPGVGIAGKCSIFMHFLTMKTQHLVIVYY